MNVRRDDLDLVTQRSDLMVPIHSSNSSPQRSSHVHQCIFLSNAAMRASAEDKPVRDSLVRRALGVEPSVGVEGVGILVDFGVEEGRI